MNTDILKSLQTVCSGSRPLQGGYCHIYGGERKVYDARNCSENMEYKCGSWYEISISTDWELHMIS